MTQTAADICRERGWGPKQLVQFRLGGESLHIVRITAVGEDVVVYRTVGLHVPVVDPGWAKQVLGEMITDASHFGDGESIDRLPWEVPNDAA